jgi:hypothetical protein
MRERYYVTVTRPEGVSVPKMRDYIRDALVGYKGGPAWELKPTVVREPAEQRDTHKLAKPTPIDQIQQERAVAWGKAIIAQQLKARKSGTGN